MPRFICQVCKKPVYRSPAQITSKRCGKTCSLKCKGIYFRGKNSSWWNRSHSEKSKRLISASRKGKCIGNQNAKGYKHTEAALQRIAEASKQLWKLNRNKMLAALPRGDNHFWHKLPTERRHRVQFSPLQRREWKDALCAYCGVSENLELDHIIPVFEGGTNVRSNCQTLCRGCNLFKTHYVDKPRYFARLGRQRDQFTIQ